MTTITFEYPCGEYQNGWFNQNGTTIATGTLIEIKGDTAIVQFDSSRHETGLEPGQTIKIPVDQVMEQLANAFVYRILDTCICPKCGPRLKSLAEVVARGEGFICTACNSVVQSEEMEIPF